MVGATTLAKAVECTLGPSGKTVLIDDRFGSPIVTRDGVTVARAVSLRDPVEQIGASLLADAALKVDEQCGDGTTTTVSIAYGLLEATSRLMSSGADPVVLAGGLSAASELAISAVMQQSRPMLDDDIKDVAGVSCKGDQRVVDAVTTAYQHLGESGTVVLRDGNSDTIELRLENGFHFDKGWSTEAFGLGEPSITLEQCFVLITPLVIDDARHIGAIMEFCAKAGYSLLVIAKGIIGSALQTMTGNQRDGALACCAIAAPHFGAVQQSFLEDVACWTVGRIVDLPGGFTTDALGYVERVCVTKSRTVLTDPNPENAERVSSRISYLTDIRGKSRNDYDKDHYGRSIGRLRGKTAEILVGAPTVAETRTLKDSIQDAIGAVRVAKMDGLVPGAGHALLIAAARLREHSYVGEAMRFGVGCMARALMRPAFVIAKNAGCSTWNAVVDAAAGRHPEGIVDPAAVVCSAIRTAASTVALLVTSETVIRYERPDGRVRLGLVR